MGKKFLAIPHSLGDSVFQLGRTHALSSKGGGVPTTDQQGLMERNLMCQVWINKTWILKSKYIHALAGGQALSRIVRKLIQRC